LSGSFNLPDPPIESVIANSIGWNYL